MKFIHLADCHFDAPLVELAKTNKANSRRREIKDTFSKVFDYAIAEKVDVVFISGDLFEHEYVDKSTIQFINSQFERDLNINIFISPGNHDPYISNSYYNLFEWSKNVYIFNGMLQKVYLSEYNANIWGVGFNNFYVDKSLIDNITIEADKLNFLVCHGTLDDTGNEARYHTISSKFLTGLGLDYCALGHIHKSLVDEKNGICYSGSLEPLGFDETGEHGFIVGEVTKEYRVINFHAICNRKYYIKEIDITGATSLQEIIDDIKFSLNTKRYEKDFIKVVLFGQLDDVNVDIEEIEETLSSSYFYICAEDKTSDVYNFAEIENEYTLKGLFIKRMNELISKADEDNKEMLIRALNYGFDALNNKNIKI